MSKFESSESAFNFAVEYLKSLKQSLDAAKFCAVRQDIDGWYNWILAANRELSLMTSTTEDEEFTKDVSEINKMMNNPHERVIKKREILNKLHLLEVKIRKKMQQKGMVLPKKSDPRFAVLER